MSTVAKIVTVTGASGYVAGSVIAELTRRGFQVRGTVRSLSNPEKVRHLREAFPELQLFEADLLSPGSFDQAFDGADYILHTASPFQPQVENPQRDLVDPALLGTENVIKTALKYDSIKRVVVTSSAVAILNESVPPEGKVHTEEDWNTESTLETMPYWLSKRLAEQAAWRLIGEQSRVELAVVNPSFVLGPPFSTRTDSTSIAVVKRLIEGNFANGAPNSCFGVVDVRDLARAHVEAMLRPEAAGHRFLLAHPEGFTHVDLGQLLRDNGFEHLKLPTTLSAPIRYRPRFSSAKAQTILGIELRPVRETIVDMARYLIDNGIAHPAEAVKSE